MIKILSLADIHINLHKKKIPLEWQLHRYNQLFSKLLELETLVDVIVIAGDVFDRTPEPDEICLFLSYANRVSKPTIIIPGNHDASSKGNSFLSFFTGDNVIVNDNIKIYTQNTRVEILGQGFQMFHYGE